MLFSSLYFMAAIPCLMLAGRWIKAQYRYLLLLAFSLYFYGSLSFPSLYYLIGLAAITWLCAAWLNHSQARAKKHAVIASNVLVACMLLFTKYTNFIASIFTGNLNLFSIFVPIGISFITFHALSYLFDVYKGRVSLIRNPLELLFYLSFFAHILQGPISKSRDFIPQIKQPSSPDAQSISFSFFQIACGYFLKYGISNQIARIVNPVFSSTASYSGIELWIAMFLYAIQIYTDFAGYSNIAIGIARCLGFNVKMNFNRPYFSKTIAEFWNRWHISLGEWFKEYIYFPLGGSRKGRLRQYRNILIVFLISGLWHGSTLNFLIWGILHGCYQVIGYILLPLRKQFKRFFHITGLIEKLFATGFTFILVTLTWTFFRISTFSEASNVLHKMLTLDGARAFLSNASAVMVHLFKNEPTLIVLAAMISVLFIASMLMRKNTLFAQVHRLPVIARYSFYILLTTLTLYMTLRGSSSVNSSFIYFQF